MQLKSGPVAYVVPDRELPLVNIAVYVHTGAISRTGRQGRPGRTHRLPAGARRHQIENRRGTRRALAFLAADLNSDVGETQGSVSLNLLSKDLDEGLGILREVLDRSAVPGRQDRACANSRCSRT